jgi:hypothetical protein
MGDENVARAFLVKNAKLKKVLVGQLLEKS